VPSRQLNELAKYGISADASLLRRRKPTILATSRAPPIEAAKRRSGFDREIGCRLTVNFVALEQVARSANLMSVSGCG
jgi:hypothetical protein